MAFSLGPNSNTEFISTGAGAKRRVRLISFFGRADTGAINHPMIVSGEHVVAVIDVSDGSIRTTEFTDILAHGIISQTDTGPSGHTMFALITDTGA